MINSSAGHASVAIPLWISARGIFRPVGRAARKPARGTHRHQPVLEALDGRILLSRFHTALPSSGTVAIVPLRNEQSSFLLPSPPPPVFINLPLIQPGGRILSQFHVLLYHHIFLANQTFQADTGVSYLSRFTDSARSVGATTAGTADDTSAAVSTFFQQLTSQVASHGGSTTEFPGPANGNGGSANALAANGVIVSQSYVATRKLLTFTMTYATPDSFVFKEQFQLRAFRLTTPQPGSSFSLLDAITVFNLHFPASG